MNLSIRDEVVLQAKLMVENGKTLKHAAATLKISIPTIRRRLTALGLAVPKHWKNTINESGIVNDYLCGISGEGVARKHGISRCKVKRILRDNNLGMRQHLGNTRFPLNHNAFDIISERSAYWAGFLMADGNVFQYRNETPEIKLQLSVQDIDHLDLFRDFLDCYRPINVSNVKSPGSHNIYTYATFRFRSQRIAERLASFGVIPNKTYCAKAIILEKNVNFWRGVVDGDGWVRIKRPGNPVIGLIGTQHLVSQFSEFVYQRFGFTPSIHKLKNSRAHSVIIESSRAYSVIHLLYNNCELALARKLTIANEIISYYCNSSGTPCNDTPN